MNTLPFLLISVLVTGLITAVIIWIVGKLNLGLEVDGFGAAFAAAIIIAVVAGVISLLLGLAGLMDGAGLVVGLAHLVVTALVLMVAGRILPGLRVKGFVGALVAAVAVGVLYWLGGLLLAQII